ncbi:MAG: hypothetical protein II841_10170 [Bacteroidales bacterium]|nr:hypothetical protein [Bacteroidales bacterium]
MQILLNIEEDVFYELCPNDSDLNWEALERVYGLKESEESVDIVNIGPGADWMVLLTTFNIAWKLFQAPDIIRNSLDTWKRLINKS